MRLQNKTARGVLSRLLIVSIIFSVLGLSSVPLALAAITPPKITCKVTQGGKDYTVDYDYIDINNSSPKTVNETPVHWEITMTFNHYGDPYKGYKWNESVNSGSLKQVGNVTSPSPTTQKTVNGSLYDTMIMTRDVSYPKGTKRVDTNFVLSTGINGSNPPKTKESTGGCAMITRDPTTFGVLQGTTPTKASPATAIPNPGTPNTPTPNTATPVGTINTNQTVGGGTVNTGTSTGTAMGTSSGTTTTQSAAAADSGESGASSTTTQPPLTPSPDILTCTASARVLYFENSEPAYDRISANCALKKGAIVTAHVYNKSYDPKSQDNSANLIKTIFLPILKNVGAFSVGWDGHDDYDQAAALGDYSFVVEAKLDNSYMPDISIQQFKVENVPAPVVANTNGTTTTSSSSTNASTGATSTTTTTTSTSTELHAAAPAPTPAPAATPSKCPGVNYPSDIDSSPAKELILKAYDLCFVKGYADGTFKGKQNITRAESTKIAVLAAGKIAKQGCYDADCGSPFMDLDMWQGPWIRAAWDLKMVVGVSPSQFAPNRNITKAESASLIDRALNIPPHTGCYNANCGAGYPDDLFLDVIHMWEGPYLRPLWDKRAIRSVEPHKFFPDIPITRELFIEILMKARG